MRNRTGHPGQEGDTDMKFQTVNELEHFSFEDCVITGVRYQEGRLSVILEALIVLPENSQNKNYTKSYAGEAELLLRDCRLVSAVREGYRYMNADGVLLETAPDIPLGEQALKELKARVPGAYLFSAAPSEAGRSRKADGGEADAEENGPKQCYSFRIEFPPEEEFDTLPTESYELVFTFREAIVSWDHYMNRVQTPGM